jgi:phosphoenolpyruvate synthase/pyruvate phosphate dikinase
MEFTQPGEPGRVKTVDVSHEQRNRYSITDEDVIELAKYAVIIEKHYSVRWTSSGARTVATARSSSCRHVRKR